MDARGTIMAREEEKAIATSGESAGREVTANPRMKAKPDLDCGC
jgi:hypothetical protein